ncbi:MAG: hypothetical protein ABJC13_15930 [Acidobacteriota bacterium]
MGLAASAGAAGGWDQAYGNLANTGFVNTTTNIPVVANWAFSLEGEVGTSGPAVDSVSGTIYLGSANGTFWSILPDGKLNCKRMFKDRSIPSVPAIFPNGDVAILLTRPAGDKKQTALVRMAPNCSVVWQVDLPTMFGNPSSASGSAKIWTLDGRSFLFVHVHDSNFDFSFEPYSFDELIVFDDLGRTFARLPVGDGCLDLRGGGRFSADPHRRKDSSGSPDSDVAGQVAVTTGWPDSTPAILDTPLHGFSTPRAPLVAVTDDLCDVRLEVLQFDPAAATVAGRLVKRWGHRGEEDGVRLSSPTVTPEGLIVFGTSCYRVRIYDLNTLSLRSSFDSTYAVMHPPALAPDAWLVNSEYAAHLLKPGTNTPIDTARPQPVYTLGSATGVAASLNEMVVPNLQELGVWSHDLLSRTHALDHEEFRTSSPALTPDGRLYVVSQTSEKSFLFALGPP